MHIFGVDHILKIFQALSHNGTMTKMTNCVSCSVQNTNNNSSTRKSIGKKMSFWERKQVYLTVFEVSIIIDSWLKPSTH